MSVSWLDEDGDGPEWFPIAPPAVRWSQWHVGARSWLPRVCCSCGGAIWPGSRHHRIEGDRGVRRVHYSYCPDARPPGDPFPPDSAFDRAVENVNAWIGAACIAACGIAAIVFMLIVGGWRP